MRKPGPGRKVLTYAILALALSFTPARAGFNASVTATEAPRAGGLYLYTYTVSVAASSTVSASEFDVAVNDPIGLGSITPPNDFFTFYSPGDSTISFTAFDAGITPGHSGTFSFTSLSAPGRGMVPDLIRGLDSSTFTVDDIPGMIIGPAVVPEPSSLLLCALGGVGVGLLARARRRPSA